MSKLDAFIKARQIEFLSPADLLVVIEAEERNDGLCPARAWCFPKRIQRKRTKGWRMPPSTVYVGRPTKWGNPFTLSSAALTHEQRQRLGLADLVRFYHHWILGQADLIASLDELRGKDLCCWCPPDQPCHADVLLEIANR